MVYVPGEISIGDEQDAPEPPSLTEHILLCIEKLAVSLLGIFSTIACPPGTIFYDRLSGVFWTSPLTIRKIPL